MNDEARPTSPQPINHVPRYGLLLFSTRQYTLLLTVKLYIFILRSSFFILHQIT